MFYNGEGVVEFYKDTQHKGSNFSDGSFDIKNQKRFQGTDQNGGASSNLNTAYLIDGKLHNRHEMGAIIWGAISAKIEISTEFLYLTIESAHQITEGNGEELNEMNMWRLGRHVYGLKEYHPPLEKNVTVKVDWVYGIIPTIEKIKTQGDDPTKDK